MLTMRARKLIIWLGLIVLGVPMAIILLNDSRGFIDNIELVASLLIILSLVY